MLDALRERKGWVQWAVRIFLVLIALTFAVWGVESFFMGGNAGTGAIATVDGTKITEFEFNRSLKDQQDRMREAMGGKVDQEMLNNPEMRQSVVDNLINREIVLRDAYRAGLVVTDDQLRDFIKGLAGFQKDGQFSRETYQAYLRNQGYSEPMFDSLVREDLQLERYSKALSDSAFVPRVAVEQFVKVWEQQREVSIASFRPEEFEAQVSIDAAAQKKYYDANPNEFKEPEKVKIEYAKLSADELASQMKVEQKEIEDYYKANEKDYVVKEERQASHILISVGVQAPEAEKTAARAKAEDLLKQVKANPGKFAELATQHSQDPGSAQQGGDLGFFGRGNMVAAFDAAVFSMKKDEITGPVETEFGFHIIRLADIKAERRKTIAEATEEITRELQRQKAGREFAAKATEFSDLVYEQFGDLKPAATKLNLQIQQSDWLARGVGGGDALLNNPKLLEAVFADSARKDKRNTEAIEVASNTLVSARVIDYKAETKKPFAEVAQSIAEKLKREEAGKLASKKAQELLTQLKAGKSVDGVKWSEVKLISRANPGEAGLWVRQVFAADTKKVPVFIGEATPGGGYTLLRVSKVVNVDKVDEAKAKPSSDQLGQLYSQESFGATIKGLRERAKINIKQDVLKRSADQSS